MTTTENYHHVNLTIEQGELHRSFIVRTRYGRFLSGPALALNIDRQGGA